MMEQPLSTGLKINWQGHERVKDHSSPFYLYWKGENLFARERRAMIDTFMGRNMRFLQEIEAHHSVAACILSFRASNSELLRRLWLITIAFGWQFTAHFEVISLMTTSVIRLGYCRPEDVHCTHAGYASLHCEMQKGQFVIFSNPNSV